MATATIKNFLKLRLHAFNGSGKMLFSSYRELVKPKGRSRDTGRSCLPLRLARRLLR